MSLKIGARFSCVNPCAWDMALYSSAELADFLTRFRIGRHTILTVFEPLLKLTGFLKSAGGLMSLGTFFFRRFISIATTTDIVTRTTRAQATPITITLTGGFAAAGPPAVQKK